MALFSGNNSMGGILKKCGILGTVGLGNGANKNANPFTNSNREGIVSRILSERISDLIVVALVEYAAISLLLASIPLL